MSANDSADRLTLPKDSFRGLRSAPGDKPGVPTPPVVVTPVYGDDFVAPAVPRSDPKTGRPAPAQRQDRDPFKAYGERSSSRPYALRLPDAIDLALRQIAAEERVHPLRIIDRILHEYLARVGRLPQITDDRRGASSP